MPKIIVDEKLAETLKSMRIDKKLLAKELASKWGKSASYISKLESGTIKSIELEELIQCLQLIVGAENSDEYISELIKTVTFKYKKEEIAQLLWMANFDEVYRRIPVPEAFIADVNAKLQKHSISVAKLVDQINSNEFIPQQLRDDLKIPTNMWINASDKRYVKMQLAYSDVERLLSREKRKSNYIALDAIALYLFRMIDYSHIDTFSIGTDSDDYMALKSRARAYLESFRIYTLTRKADLVERVSSEPEIGEQLSLYDRENLRIIEEVHDALAFYSDFDVATANQQIKQFTQNLDWDSPFIMQIAGLPFDKLGQCSFRIKKSILTKIRQIFDEALDIPEEQRRLEQY